jgi:simple sugar transport system permease protein
MRTRFQFHPSSLIGPFASVAAVVVALILGAVVIFISGSDPVEAYQALFEGAFVGKRRIADTLIYTAPLLLGGLAFAIAARAGMFNIGVEGQLIVGGFAAGLVGAWDLGLPSAVYVPLALFAAAVAGGFWGFIPGFLRAKTGAHEVITTIMLNYLAIRMITYLSLRQPDLLPVDPNTVATGRIVDAARLPKIWEGTRLHLGFVIAMVAAVVLWYVLYRTTFGYRVRAVGLSRGASAYGGINWGVTIMVAMTVAGVLAGLAGAGESLGLHGRHWSTPPGYGFTAIAVGLVGRNNPLAIILSALLFGALSSGAPSMQSADVSKEIVLVIQGLIILAVAALEVIGRIPALRQRGPAATSTRDASTEVPA